MAAALEPVWKQSVDANLEVCCYVSLSAAEDSFTSSQSSARKTASMIRHLKTFPKVEASDDLEGGQSLCIAVQGSG